MAKRRPCRLRNHTCGDDETTIGGETTIRRTGSEDFFNGGGYDVPDRWEKNLSFPLSGCLAYQKPLGRSGGYRLMLGDAYAFRKSIRHFSPAEHMDRRVDFQVRPSSASSTTWP